MNSAHFVELKTGGVVNYAGVYAMPTATHLKVARGFTLIELLIVIAIIGIIAAIVIPQFQAASGRLMKRRRLRHSTRSS